MPDKSTNFLSGTHQVLSYNSEAGAKRFKKLEAPMSHFSNNGELTLAKILEQSRFTCIIIIKHLYTSKSPHIVIFWVQLSAQVLSYDSETGNRRSMKSEAPMSHFCNNEKLSLAKILEKTTIYYIS